MRKSTGIGLGIAILFCFSALLPIAISVPETPVGITSRTSVSASPTILPSIQLGPQFDGQQYFVDDVAKITWTSYGGVGNLRVKLEYTITGIAGPWVLIKDSLSANGSQDWLIPNIAFNRCYIQATVTDSNGNVSYDWNDPYFYIIPSAKRGVLLGKAVDESGQPISGATVVIYTSSKKTTLHTAANGSFWAVLVPDQYNADVSRTGFKTNQTFFIISGWGDEIVNNTVILHPEDPLPPIAMAGTALFGLFVMFCIIVFYIIDRRRKREWLKKHPPKWKKHKVEEDDDDVDKFWGESDER